ncbi:MAG: bifunctional UDP-N-acetylglucosamine diphosphorylase/glucosamine-1-phosphate N-acetyltransferase GlmU [Candidatus Aminicenantes bacterium]|jgi:bifunctional UDP-N-acetylglucosamine pyrophosphorylase/glucosamine-1-phosphate N-acetyltransferase
MKKGLSALILAAGKGTRFKSDKIKVLHPLLGKSMLQLVVDSIQRLKPDRIHIVVGYQKDLVQKSLSGQNIDFIFQKKQLGTAHAVLTAQLALEKETGSDLLIMNGDLPLIRSETLKPMLRSHREKDNSLTFMTADLDDPTGFGRVILSEDKTFGIVEEKDATPAQKRVKEVNVGIYLFRIKDLLKGLAQVTNKNKKGEYYLTDMIEILSRSGKKVGKYKTGNTEEIVGVNDRLELARAIDVLRLRKIKSLTEKGVTFYDPGSTWIDSDVKVGRDTVVYPSVILEGNSSIGSHCTIYPGVHVVDTRVGNGVKLFSSSMIEESVIHDEARVGPFTHLRPKTIIRHGAKVGNFVEMKNTDFGRGSKAGHLTYLGDADIQNNVNIGAGTITCNYDGERKSKTKIESGAFIGSGTELVAPVKIGKKAYVGAGSTITKDVSPEALAVSRSRQEEKPGWAKRKRKK